jgi:glycosyltransferase involved in cell wall biosynthesis
MSKLVAMVRVKDGILFVREWLDVMGKLADEIVVVDNGSTDGTLEILKAHPRVVDIAQTEGFDEGRDKIMVYEMARRRNPDWCIWLDIDEIFEESLTRSHLNNLMNSSIFNKYEFRRFHFFSDRFKYEASREALRELAYPSRTMWRESLTGYFNNWKIHNGGIQGIKGFFLISRFRIKHITNLYIEYRTKVYENYIIVDPSRIEMYQKHKKNLITQSVPTQVWYESKQRPLFVFFQYLYLNMHFVYLVIEKKVKKAFHIHSTIYY